MNIEPASISNAPVQPVRAPEPKAPTVTAQAIQPVAPKTDTVEISIPAQARQLKLEGQSINQVAYKLSLSVDTVNQYLGLVEQKQA